MRGGAFINCGHCQHMLISDITPLSPVHIDFNSGLPCDGQDDLKESFIFLPCDLLLPDWIDQTINGKMWTKGKLYCPCCSLHIGSFNFQSQMKCFHCTQVCGSPIYFLLRKVDVSGVLYPSMKEIDSEVQVSNDSNGNVNDLLNEESFGFLAKHITCRGIGTPGNISPLQDPFHPESPAISQVNLVVMDSQTFDENYDKISQELPLVRDPLHPDNVIRVERVSLSEEDDFYPRSSDPQTRYSSFGQFDSESLDEFSSDDSNHFAVTQSYSDQAISKSIPQHYSTVRSKNRGRRRRHLEQRSRDRPLKITTSSDSDCEIEPETRKHYSCPICLELLYHPLSCEPCHHVFCTACLKRQAFERPASTRCAVCRTYIHHVEKQRVLSDKLQLLSMRCRTKRRRKERETGLETWPLPGLHRGAKSYQICCLLASIQASKHRQRYLLIFHVFLYTLVIGLPIFSLVIATIFT